ncbi:hypothetical protein HDU87_002917 [Geranomyces variabilis]|uniref:Pleckstrin homology domain-containing protein n=1 Tax=Geranomyces variabilis TaxID=109894 RepID=A0AAD5XMY6_9FUNG|nr:hypothetical protein HDU87_002917 [Geranomyces variabilis]
MIADDYAEPTAPAITAPAQAQRSDLSATNIPRNGSTGKRSSVGRSPTAALISLRAENDDLRRRLEETEGKLELAATVGQSLLKEHDALRARLNETDLSSDESGSRRQRVSFDHIRGIEDGLNIMGSSLKGFVGSLSRPASPEGGRELKTRTRVLQNESPKLSRKLSRKGFMKPQSPRKLAARSNKFVDMELASDIDNHLIHQVRILRQELGAANEEKRELTDSVARLEAQAEGARKQRQKDLQLAAKKDERIWDLELQAQQLRDAASKAETEAARMFHALRQMDSAYGESVDAMAAMQNADSQNLNSFEAIRARLDGEARRSRDLIAALESANALLTQKCADLRREADALRARRNSAAPLAECDPPTDPITSNPDRSSSPVPSSHPPSPDRSPTKHTLFVESLSSSLSHAHAQISELEESVRESVLERQELIKLLNEAQETIESLNEMRTTVPSTSGSKNVDEDAEQHKPRHSRIPDGFTTSSKKIARNLLSEFQEAFSASQKDSRNRATDSKSCSVDAEAGDDRTSSPRISMDMQDNPESGLHNRRPPDSDGIQSDTASISAEQGSAELLHPKALAPAVEGELFVPIAADACTDSVITLDSDLELTSDLSLADVSLTLVEPPARVRSGGKYSLAVTKAQDKLMVQLEEIVGRQVELVLCVDGCMQTLKDGDEPHGVFAQRQPSVLTIKQRPKLRNAVEHGFVNGGTTMESAMVADWMPRAVSTPTLSIAAGPNIRERATSDNPNSGNLPSRSKLPTAQRQTVNAWGAQYLASKTSPMPWPIPPGNSSLRSPDEKLKSAKMGASTEESPPLSPKEGPADPILAPTISSAPQSEESKLDTDVDRHSEAQTCGQSVNSIPESTTTNAHPPLFADLADLESAGIDAPNAEKPISSTNGFESEHSEWDDDLSHDAISANSIVSSTTERRLMDSAAVSPQKPLSRRIRRTGHGSIRGATRNVRQRGGGTAGHPLPTLMQSVKTFASLKSLGNSSVAFSEGSKGSVEDKSDRDIRSLTHTMIGSWFQKFNRHNRKPKLRYFWVNPYSRALNWAPKPPSQGKKNMQTKTVFIVSLRWKEPDRSYRNYPPGPDHAIVIVTPHREVRVVPTSWNDFEMWVAGLSLLLERTHRNRPLHEQFGITDRAYADHDDDGESESAHALPGDSSTADDQRDELRSKSMIELARPPPALDNSDYRDAEMTLDELGASILERHRAPAMAVGQKGPPVLRRNSLWASMQDLTRGSKSGLPRPVATTPIVSPHKSTGSGSSGTSVMVGGQAQSIPAPSTPKQLSGLPMAPHTVASAARRPSELQQPSLHRRPSIGDMLLTASRRFSRSDLSLSSSGRRRSTLMETPKTDSAAAAPPIPKVPHRSASSSSLSTAPTQTSGQDETVQRPRALTTRKSVGAVMRDRIRNISGSSFSNDNSAPPLPGTASGSEHFVPGARQGY